MSSFISRISIITLCKSLSRLPRFLNSFTISFCTTYCTYYLKKKIGSFGINPPPQQEQSVKNYEIFMRKMCEWYPPCRCLWWWWWYGTTRLSTTQVRSVSVHRLWVIHHYYTASKQVSQKLKYRTPPNLYVMAVLGVRGRTNEPGEKVEWEAKEHSQYILFCCE